jgi:hypothetical protein
MERDTSPAAAKVQREMIHRLGIEGRVRMAIEMSEDARQISLDGIERRNPELTDDQALHSLLCMIYVEDLATKFARFRSSR